LVKRGLVVITTSKYGSGTVMLKTKKKKKKTKLRIDEPRRGFFASENRSNEELACSAE
jgi:predicted SPOUT superfamily RNA methylase MTH1